MQFLPAKYRLKKYSPKYKRMDNASKRETYRKEREKPHQKKSSFNTVNLFIRIPYEAVEPLNIV